MVLSWGGDGDQKSTGTFGVMEEVRVLDCGEMVHIFVRTHQTRV